MCADRSWAQVILLHPFMLHSASRNSTRRVRIITNPPVSLRKPLEYNRSNQEEYSLVERKTLLELGLDPLCSGRASEKGYGKGGGYESRLNGERQDVVPERLKVQKKWREEELVRLAAIAA